LSLEAAVVESMMEITEQAEAELAECVSHMAVVLFLK
jgi:hypothetical protein